MALLREQRSFLKRTRRGKIVKVVREHYLRTDIHCARNACDTCSEVLEGEQSRLPRLPARSESGLMIGPHYIVVDTNVVLNQIDVLETAGMENVVVLTTVLQEVLHRSSPIYKRLKDLLEDPNRQVATFVNEHHADCYVERRPGESANDRNDRAIRTATAWYRKHVQGDGAEVVMLSDDRENRRLAEKEDGLRAFSTKEYVESIAHKYPDLVDKIKNVGDDFEGSDDASSKGKKFLFPEHYGPTDINVGIKQKKLYQGVFYVNRSNYLEATINSSSHDAPVLVQGLEHMNRAFDGDTVAFQLLDKSEWSAPAEVILEDDLSVADRDDSLENEKKVLEASAKSADVQATGRVVGIIKRNWRSYCGILQMGSNSRGTRHLFVAAEKKIPKIRIETRQADRLKGQRIIVAVDAWPRHSRYPNGHFVRALGPIGDKATENEVLLLEHDIPHSSFSEAVLDCLPKMPWIISERDEAERVDLRQLNICSVDPPGCTDIDDALHCRPLEDGSGLLEVGVHIADVSHFIRPGTAIDREAADRSTTVYLTDRRIDMVPALLSSDLCSLRGGVERFAFSCVWTMTPEAKIVSTRFHKSIIHSKAAMTYEEAQNRIDDDTDQTDLTQGLRQLLRLSKVLKQRRLNEGALLLASSEIRFDVDAETSDPTAVQPKVIRETNSMVEEFMLAANISAAKMIFEEFPDCAMLRRHPAPPPSNFDPLIKAGKQQGFEIKVDTNKSLSESLNAAVEDTNNYFNTMLRMIATRCMMQAVYFASGSIEEPLFAHYGLACPIYTHFTSPIRRYADVIVHRLLAAAIGADATYPKLLDKKETQKIANNINYRHRMAQYASRASVNLHTHLFFRDRRQTETGYVLFVRQNALQILIPKFGLEGILFLRSSDCDKRVSFVYDESVPSQTCGTVTFRLFQRLRVQLSLDRSNVQHEKLVLKLVEPFIEGFSVNEEHVAVFM